MDMNEKSISLLKNKGINFKGLAFDTMIGAYIINPSSRNLYYF